MSKIISVGRAGFAGHSVALRAAVASAPPPVTHMPKPPDMVPDHGLGWPVSWSGGCRKWRKGPGKARPHIYPDGSVRVKGFKPKFKPLRKFDPPAPNHRGSKYEAAKALIKPVSAL